MKLDRNINPDGRGKYALVLMRKMPTDADSLKAVNHALGVLRKHGMLDHGEAGTKREFFVMRLRDIHAFAGMIGYHDSVMAVPEHRRDEEYATEILEMAMRSGVRSLFCKSPD